MSRWLRMRLVLDRIVAATALVVLAPLVTVLAILVKRHDGGPAFVRVERVGRNFEPFMMWKLRSMRAEGSGGRAGGDPLAAPGDERITSIGQTLRLLHLDEIPQLINVARGEMLLFGPRPESPEFVDAGDPRWSAVVQMAPGIAGPTQLVVGPWEQRHIAADPSGGAYREVVLPVKLAIDQWYVAHVSFTHDVDVAAALARSFLPGHRATRLWRRVLREVPQAAMLNSAQDSPVAIVVTRPSVSVNNPSASPRSNRRAGVAHGQSER